MSMVVRTIRDGRVKIGGRYYKPRGSSMVYDGRLDGQRFAFGRYQQPDKSFLPFVSLWGTERAYHSDDSDTDWPGPACVNGVFVWEWWDAQ